MASSSLPVTPERNPVQRGIVRRSFTVPPKRITPLEQQPEIGATKGVETLCAIPAARVISFRTSGFGSPSIQQKNAIGTLPWRTPTEMTLAAGPLEIYRVPGSASFLHSGKLVHPILPRSQCWCVDGFSTFVFRGLAADQYYRIELPGVTEENDGPVERLRVTLQKVLQYEKTACPFKRGFTVDLPTTPELPVRRPSTFSTEPAKRWRLKGVWRPEDWNPEESQSAETSPSRYGRVGFEASMPPVSIPQDDTPSPQCPEQSPLIASEVLPDESTPSPPDSPIQVKSRPSISMRSVTAPPAMDLEQMPLEERLPVIDLDGSMHGTANVEQAEEIVEQLAMTTLVIDPVSLSQATKAQQSDQEDLSHFAIVQMSNHSSPTRGHIDQNEEEPLSAVTDDTERFHLSEDDMVEQRVRSKLSTPTLSSDSEHHSWGEVVTPPETLRLKQPIKEMPQPSIVTTHSSSPKPSRTKTTIPARRLSQENAPTGLVGKTYTILTSPPGYLVDIMLKMAARIAGGAMNMTITSPSGARRRVPGSWNLSDLEDEWDLDGYGFTMGRKQMSTEEKKGLSNVVDI